MGLTRRQFLTLIGGSTGAAVLFQACGVPPEELLVESSYEMPEDMVSGLDNWYATVDAKSKAPNGLVVRVMEGRAKKIEGNIDYPVNKGKHSSNCEASLQSLYHPDRIKAPLLRVGDRGDGKYEEISWENAIDRLSSELKKLNDSGQSSKMAFVTQPMSQHLNLMVNNFTTKFGGTHLTQEPLENTTLRKAIHDVFGENKLPDFDIENSDYILSFGTDFLSTWLSPVQYSADYGEFRQGKDKRGFLVQIDSRFSMTAANSDEWIYVHPGTEGILALSIAQVIISEGLGNSSMIDKLTNKDKNYLDNFAPSKIASKISDPTQNIEEVVSKITQIARDFANSNNPLAIGGGSAGAHTNGLSNLHNIYLLNYLVGSVNKKGGIIFNPDEAMFSKPPSTGDIKSSFSDWTEIVEELENGNLHVLLIHGADPWYGLPDSTGFKQALVGQNNGYANTSLIVSFATIMDDVSQMADLILPSHHFLEDWGISTPDPAPGHQLIGFQQPVVRPYFENRGEHLGTKSFPNILLSIAKDPNLNLKLDFEGDTYLDIIKSEAKEIYKSGRGTVGVTPTSNFSNFESFWNTALQHGFWQDLDYTPKTNSNVPAFDINSPGPSFSEVNESKFYLIPFASNSLGDGISNSSLPWLQNLPDPISTAVWRTWVEINSSEAKKMNIKEGDIVKVTSEFGSIEAIAFPNPATPPQVLSIPLGQGHLNGGRFAEKRGANVLSILAPKESGAGALAWAATRVKMTNTGKWKRLPKFENDVSEFPTDLDQHIIKITRYDT